MVFLGILGVSISSWSRDLSGHLGIGFQTLIRPAITSLSTRYFFNAHLIAQGMLGVDTSDSSGVVGLKIYRALPIEEPLNIYVGGGALFTTAAATAGGAGLRLQMLFGGEYFLPSVPEIGIVAELGFEIAVLGLDQFRTLGGQLGIHYYF
jgi:hypothetical protein